MHKGNRIFLIAKLAAAVKKYCKQQECTQQAVLKLSASEHNLTRADVSNSNKSVKDGNVPL